MQLRIPQCSPLVGDGIPNAIIAMGMDIMLGSACQHQDQYRKVEDRCVAECPPEGAEVDEAEEDEGDVEIPKGQPCHTGAVGTSGVWA